MKYKIINSQPSTSKIITDEKTPLLNNKKLKYSENQNSSTLINN